MYILFTYHTIYVLKQCTNIPEILRFDCHPDDGASQLSCTNRGCCWNPIDRNKITGHEPLAIPYCYYPQDWNLYKYINQSKDGSDFLGFLKQEKKSPYKNDVPLVKIEATSIDSSILRVKVIINIYRIFCFYIAHYNIIKNYSGISLIFRCMIP